MKLLDDKGKLFGKVNVIDLLLVFIVFAVVTVVGYKFLQPSDVPIAASGDTTAEVTFYGNALHPFVVDKIREGDQIRLASTNDVLGEITSVEQGPAELIASDAEGQWIKSEVPGKFKVYISIQGQAVSSRGSLKMAGVPMLAGADMEIKGPNYKIEGLISDVQNGSQ